MKFKDYEIIKDQHGFEFAKKGVMKGSKKLGCATCGEPTEFIDFCSRARICSDECGNKWYDK